MIRLSVLLLAAATAVAAAEPAPKPLAGVAVLTGLKGTVEVRRVGETAPAAVTYTSLLAVGDTVRTGKDSGAEVVFANGTVERLASESTIAVRSLGKESRPFALLRKQLATVTTPEGKPLDLKSFELRGYPLRGVHLRGYQLPGDEAAVVAAAPRYGPANEARPTFQWTAPPGTTELQLTVYDLSEK